MKLRGNRTNRWELAGGLAALVLFPAPALPADRIDLTCEYHNPPPSKWVELIQASKPSCDAHGKLVNEARKKHQSLVEKLDQTAALVAKSAVASSTDATTALAAAKKLIEESAKDYRDIATEADDSAKLLAESRKANLAKLKDLAGRHAQLQAIEGEQERQLNVFNMDTRKIMSGPDRDTRSPEVETRKAEAAKRLLELNPLQEAIQSNRYPLAQRDQSKVVAVSMALEQELRKVSANALFKAQQMDEQATKLDPARMSSEDLAKMKAELASKGKLPIELPRDKPEEQKSFYQSLKERVAGAFKTDEVPLSADVKARGDLIRDAIRAEAGGQGGIPGLAGAGGAKGIFDINENDSDFHKQAALGAEAFKDKAVTDAGSTAENTLATLRAETADAKARYAADLAKLGGFEGAGTALTGPVAEELEQRDSAIREAFKKNEAAKTVVSDGMGYVQTTEDPEARAALEEKVKARNDFIDEQCKNAFLCKALQDNGVARRLATDDVGASLNESASLRNIAENHRVVPLGDPMGASLPMAQLEAPRVADVLAEQQGDRLKLMDQHVADVEQRVEGQQALEDYAKRKESVAISRGLMVDDTSHFVRLNEKEVIALDPTAAGAVSAATQSADEKAKISAALDLKQEQSQTAKMLSMLGGPSGALDAFGQMKTAESTSNLLPTSADAAKILDDKRSEFKTEVIMAAGSAAATGLGGSMTMDVLRSVKLEMRVADDVARVGAGDAVRAADLTAVTARAEPELKFAMEVPDGGLGAPPLRSVAPEARIVEVPANDALRSARIETPEPRVAPVAETHRAPLVEEEIPPPPARLEVAAEARLAPEGKPLETRPAVPGPVEAVVARATPETHVVADLPVRERVEADTQLARNANEAVPVSTADSHPWGPEPPKTRPLTDTQKRFQAFQNEPLPVRDPAAVRDSAPKLGFLEKEHSTFRKIGEADNEAAIPLAKASNLGASTEVKRAATMQAAVGKSLNDVIVKNKDRVNQLLNLQKDLVWEKVAADPVLSESMIGKYSDFNTMKFLFDSNSPEIDKRLTNIFQGYNRRYSEFLGSVAKSEGWDERAVGLAKSRDNWHHLGIGATPDEANIAARKSRELFDANGLSRPRTYEEVKGLVEKDFESIEATRAGLANRFAANDGVLAGQEGRKVLSAEAIDTIRKAEQTDAGVKKALETQFQGLKLSDQDVKDLRGYVAKADSFSPDLYVGKRVEIPLDARPHGAISGDFAGQNARNLEETMKAMADPANKSLEDQIRAIRAGEEKATAVLDAKKNDFYGAIEKVFGKDDPEFRQHVYFSGDDGIYLPATPLTDAQKNELAAALAAKPNSVRLTFNPSRYADTGELIPVSYRSTYIVAAEKVEKDLRVAMKNAFPREVMNNSQIAVELTPYADGRESVGIYLGGHPTADTLARMNAWASDYLAKKGVSVDFVKVLP